jgi:hypothetical protein
MDLSNSDIKICVLSLREGSTDIEFASLVTSYEQGGATVDAKMALQETGSRQQRLIKANSTK